MKVSCLDCGESFDRLGHHWAMSECEYPSLSDKQHEILTGLLMGDASVSTYSDRNSQFKCDMITPEFLEWVDDEMGVFGTGVRFYMSAADAANQDKISGFNPNAHPSNYSDKYRWNSRRHPSFNLYRDNWYSPSGKRFLSGLKLTPLILKVWFCCDGSLEDDKRDNGRPRFSICCSNESDRENYLSSLFSDIDVDVRFHRGEYEDGGDRLSIYFGVDDSEYLWDYMGDPLPGFEYKWDKI